MSQLSKPSWVPGVHWVAGWGTRRARIVATTPGRWVGPDEPFDMRRVIAELTQAHEAMEALGIDDAEFWSEDEDDLIPEDEDDDERS